MEPTTYRPIPGYALYRVGSDGSVLKLTAAGTWRRLKPWAAHGGHLWVQLCRDGERAVRAVRELVLEAFGGPRPPGTVPRHRNGDKADNRAGNLRWGPPDPRNARRFPPTVVRAIRAERAAGAKRAAVAYRFGVDEKTVWQIETRQTYRDVA